MDVEIRNGPAFAVGRCTLGGGEQMKAEAGAMMAHSVGVEVEAKVQGGLMKGLKRSILGGESLFMTTWTAPNEGAGSTWPPTCRATSRCSTSTAR
jgi:uncharacterized protein (AIM24 family)